LDGEGLDVNTASDMECVSAILAPLDLHFQKKLKLIEDKCEIPNRCKHDEKSGTILEEKGDVPFVHRSV
jgi:hypothetical protein